jgi:hypothetical protein
MRLFCVILASRTAFALRSNTVSALKGHFLKLKCAWKSRIALLRCLTIFPSVLVQVSHSSPFTRSVSLYNKGPSSSASM